MTKIQLYTATAAQLKKLTTRVTVRPSHPVHPALVRYQHDFLHPLPHLRTFLLRCQPLLHYCPPLCQPRSHGRLHLQWCLHHRRLFPEHRCVKTHHKISPATKKMGVYQRNSSTPTLFSRRSLLLTTSVLVCSNAHDQLRHLHGQHPI